MRLIRHRERGVALLVVVGVLATLSLLIATFAMLMSVESTAARNQAEYEMARQAALAGLDHVVTGLRANPGMASSGNFDVLCSDPQNPSFCRELTRRDGLKSGYLIHPADSATGIHANLAGQSWAGIPTAPVGSLSAGMFDINGMGFAADSDCYMHHGIRYTSSEASLYQTLCSVFATVAPNYPSAGNDINTCITGFTGSADTQKTIARVLSHAIVSRRYGSDGLPGVRGKEDHRLDHLPSWYRWTPNYSTSDYATTKNADKGTSPSALLWGRISSFTPDPPPAAQPATYEITANTALPGWRNWVANQWQGQYAYVFGCEYDYPPAGLAVPKQVRTGRLFAISSNTATKFTIQLSLPSDADWVPMANDIFCFVPATAAVGIGISDATPTAVLWPNGVLSTENFVRPLYIDEGRIPVAPADATHVTIATNMGTLQEGGANGYFILHILTGPFRGQVRRIADNAGPVLTLVDALTVPPSAALASLQGCWYRVEFDAYPTHSAAYNSLTSANSGNNTLYVQGGYVNLYNAFSGCAVTILADTTNPKSVGQSRLILKGNTFSPSELTLARNWPLAPDDRRPAAGARFRVELPQDYKYAPDNLQGDDITYKSVAEVLSVMSDALADYGLSAANAPKAAAILYSTGYNPATAATTPPLKDVLTIANNLTGSKQQYVSINDWACDGIDNNRNGVIDDADEATYEDTEVNKAQKLGRELYVGLGLYDWVHVIDKSVDPVNYNLRLRQAAQVVANMIDFRDADDLSTVITNTDLGETDAAVTVFTVRGYEGVHFSEIMSTPPVIDYNATVVNGHFLKGDPGEGTELVNDGVRAVWPGGTHRAAGPPYYDELDDLEGWNWDGTNKQWYLKIDYPAGDCLGQWVFDLGRLNYGFKRGWYAIRLRGKAGAELRIQSGGQTGRVTFDATGWGYARLTGATYPLTKLMAVNVDASGKLAFSLGSQTKDDYFDGFQLLPQFVEITNCSARDVRLDYLEISGKGTISLANAALNGTTVRGVVIGGTPTSFPPVYGTYVVAVSEEAYARQYGAGAKDATWGNTIGEDYPVCFVGDPWSTDASIAVADGRMAVFTLGMPTPPAAQAPHTPIPLPDMILHAYDPLTDAPVVLTQTGAADAIDGDPNASSFPLEPRPAASYGHYPYVSREKAVSPFSTAWRNWSFESDPTALAPITELGASQNVSYCSTDTARTNLNRSYVACWQGTPTVPTDTWAGYPVTSSSPRVLLTTAATFAAGAYRVYPVILNRPYASPGWLGLVPGALREVPAGSGVYLGAWRTIDSNPTPGTLATGPDQVENLLGLFLSRAIVGGVHSRINLNNPADAHTRHALRSILSTTPVDDVSKLMTSRPAGAGWSGWGRNPIYGTGATRLTDWYRRFVGWEELLNNTTVQSIATTSPYQACGAGTIQYDIDSAEEFVRRYSNLLDLRTSNLKFIIAGLVYENGARPGATPPSAADVPDAPVAQARIEVEIDMSGPARVVQFRYLTE